VRFISAKFNNMKFANMKFVNIRFFNIKFTSIKFADIRFTNMRFISIRFVINVIIKVTIVNILKKIFLQYFRNKKEFMKNHLFMVLFLFFCIIINKSEARKQKF